MLSGRCKTSSKLCQQTDSIISPLPFHEWAALSVHVTKQDGTVYTGDDKLAVNSVWILFPSPKPVGSQPCFQFDYPQACQQVAVKSSTHHYLFTPREVCFYINIYGTVWPLTIFQHIMDQLLQELLGVACYLDDVLATGKGLPKALEHFGSGSFSCGCNLVLSRKKCFLFQVQIKGSTSRELLSRWEVLLNSHRGYC